VCWRRVQKVLGGWIYPPVGGLVYNFLHDRINTGWPYWAFKPSYMVSYQRHISLQSDPLVWALYLGQTVIWSLHWIMKSEFCWIVSMLLSSLKNLNSKKKVTYNLRINFIFHTLLLQPTYWSRLSCTNYKQPWTKNMPQQYRSTDDYYDIVKILHLIYIKETTNKYMYYSVFRKNALLDTSHSTKWKYCTWTVLMFVIWFHSFTVTTVKK